MNIWSQLYLYYIYGDDDCSVLNTNSKDLSCGLTIKIQCCILLKIFQFIHGLHCFAYSRHGYGSLTSCLIQLYKEIVTSYYNFIIIEKSLADSSSYPVASMSGIFSWYTSIGNGLLVCRSVPKGWFLSDELFIR